jgi:hypothetical protein
MSKSLKKPLTQKRKEEILFEEWLSKSPGRPETRKMNYWFNRLKKEMYGNLNHPENSKSRFYLLMKRMVITFPQYEKILDGKSYLATPVYRGIWRYFQNLLTKWKKESPEKFERPSMTLSNRSTAESLKNKKR